MVVNIGSSKFIDTERIFVVNDFDLLSIIRQEGLYLSLNVNLFDKYNRFVAMVHDNFWYIDRRYLWDIEYKPQHLILRKKPRDITLEVEIKNEEVFITGDLYYNGFLIPIKPQNFNIGGVVFSNLTAENAKHGIVINVPPYNPLNLYEIGINRFY